MKISNVTKANITHTDVRENAMRMNRSAGMLADVLEVRAYLSRPDVGRSLSRDKRPAQYMKRRLTICCDGTWQASNKAEEAKRSNVAKLAQLISPVAVDEDGTAIPQIIYYQAGTPPSQGPSAFTAIRPSFRCRYKHGRLNGSLNMVRKIIQGAGT